MKHFTTALLALSFAFSACSSTRSREPSSLKDDTQSAEFAQKLNGGSVKFRAYRKDNELSLLGFLELKFRNCQVDAGGKSETGSPITADESSFIRCEVDMSSDPVHGTVIARIKGDKRKFTTQVTLAQSNEYRLNAEISMAWVSSRWTGSGTVDGWLNKRIGDEGSLTATVRELLTF
jgi:hypothetical protein